MTSKPEDPHFEQIVNELQEVDNDVNKLVLYSVFLRLPLGTKDKAPNAPSDSLNKVDTLTKIETVLKKTNEIEDRLHEIQDNKETGEKYGDQIEDYLNDIEELQKSLRSLKSIVNYESLHDGAPGKTEVSWLTTYRTIIGTKLHKEHNALEDISDADTQDNNKEVLQGLLKKLDRIIQTSGMLQNCARYLQWFTNKIVEVNDALPEYQRDFSLDLVAGWIKTEVGKVKDHEQNSFNVKSELESKLFSESTEAEE